MTNDLLPHGEELRKAVRWISEMRAESPSTRLADLIERAARRFDLSPADEEFLLKTFSSGGDAGDTDSES